MQRQRAERQQRNPAERHLSRDPFSDGTLIRCHRKSPYNNTAARWAELKIPGRRAQDLPWISDARGMIHASTNDRFNGSKGSERNGVDFNVGLRIEGPLAADIRMESTTSACWGASQFWGTQGGKRNTIFFLLGSDRLRFVQFEPHMDWRRHTRHPIDWDTEAILIFLK